MRTGMGEGGFLEVKDLKTSGFKNLTSDQNVIRIVVLHPRIDASLPNVRAASM